MKGSMEGILPMLGLLIMAMAMATQSLPLADALAEIVGDSTKSIERIVDTRAYSDYYFFNHVALAGKYSVNEASYELGLDGGGEGGWSNNFLQSNPADILYTYWASESTEKLNDRVTGSEGGSCELPNLEYDLSPESEPSGRDTDMKIKVSDTETKGLQANCLTSSGSTEYIEDNDLIAHQSATNNRYMHLVDDTISFLQLASDKLADLSNEEYEGDSSVCSVNLEDGVDVEDEAERLAEIEARDELETAVEGKITSALSEFEERPFVDILEEKGDDMIGLPDENYYAAGNWEHISGRVKRAGETESQREGDCGCCCDSSDEDCDCTGECGDRYNGEATGEPSKVNFVWYIEDEYQKVMVEENYENLQFKVDPFTYNW